jgi:hypothetical protein
MDRACAPALLQAFEPVAAAAQMKGVMAVAVIYPV